MDRHTLKLLEFDRIRELVAARAACSLGQEAARRMEPSIDPGEVHERQALTTEMVEAISSRLTPPFGGLRDIRPLVRRAGIEAMLEAAELAEIADTLRAVGELDRWLARVGEQFPRLGGLRQGVGEFSAVRAAIESCLDSRGAVLDTASRRLSSLRREIAQSEERIQEILRRMLRSPEIKRILRFPNFTMVGHHYVLPVSKDHRGEIQGSVQRTSATNETVYIEPAAIAERSAHLSFLRDREAREIRRILRWLSAQVGMVAEPLLSSLETLAELDLVFARARYGMDYRMAPPEVVASGGLVLRDARHPLLEALFRGDPAVVTSVSGKQASQAGSSVQADPAADFLPGASVEVEQSQGETRSPEAPPVSEEPRSVVPIDVHLGDRFRILIITGPNTGGKTVALKTVGLLAVMAQSGLHIPAAEGSQLPIYDDVLADIGDEQSLEQSLSTFSSHIRRISQILEVASQRSLVLLDELGAGTDPAEGAALGRAILDELERIGCSAMVTTHIGDLKTYAFTSPHTENAAVEFDLETLRPRYRLQIGDVGQSNALRIARRLRLPESIVDRAEEYLQRRRGVAVPDWELIQSLRREAEEARAAALQAKADAERMREALEARLAELQRETQREEQVIQARARLQPGDRVVVPRLGYDRPGRVVKLDPRRRSAVVAVGHVTWNVSLDELIPQTPREPTAGHPPEGSESRGPRRPGPGPLDRFETD